jgi:hypothetical protein
VLAGMFLDKFAVLVRIITNTVVEVGHNKLELRLLTQHVKQRHTVNAAADSQHIFARLES